MKDYKTYRQLLRILRNRGISIDTKSQGSKVIRILEKENYYNVINGYKDLFLDTLAVGNHNKETYLNGTTFDEIYALYNFDREIRFIHLRFLLIIENTFKTVIAHEFSQNYGHMNYLKIANFAVPSQNLTVDCIIKLIGDIQQETARQINKQNSSVTHYINEYGYIPLWVLVNVLTFGKITEFYRCMKDIDKIVIAKKFNIYYKELHKYMKILGLARNKCAHDERFFDFRTTQNIHTNSIKQFNSLGIAAIKTNNINDLFAIAIIFAQLLSRKDFKDFCTQMNNALNKLSKALNVITIDDVKKKMGYDRVNIKTLSLLQ